LSFEVKQFWLGVLVYALVYALMMLVYVHMYMDVNTATSCAIKLHYVVYFYDVMLLHWFSFQEGDHCKYCIELSYKAPSTVYTFLQQLVVIGVVEHQGWSSSKGEGFVITLVKIPCNKSK